MRKITKIILSRKTRRSLRTCVFVAAGFGSKFLKLINLNKQNLCVGKTPLGLGKSSLSFLTSYP